MPWTTTTRYVFERPFIRESLGYGDSWSGGALTRAKVIELADGRSWPPALRNIARSAARMYDPGLLWSIKDDDFFEAIGEDLVRVYHCTRLTTFELAGMSIDGLVPLSYDFAMRRVRDAVSSADLTVDEGRLYGSSREARDEGRSGKVFLIGHRGGLADRSGVRHLLNIWGGEGINAAWHTNSPEAKRLTSVGVPTVVVATVKPADMSYASPGWLEAAVQQIRRVPRRGLTMMTTQAVPAYSIERFVHPSDPFWRRYVGWSPPNPPTV